jgi:hypothetical protein
MKKFAKDASELGRAVMNGHTSFIKKDLPEIAQRFAEFWYPYHRHQRRTIRPIDPVRSRK